MKRILAAVLLLAAGLPGWSAELSPEEKRTRGEHLSVDLLVIGPGDELYLWFGHTGLVVRDELTGRDFFYDYGLFSFTEENFYKNFAMGRLLYKMDRRSEDLEISYMNYFDRSIERMPLDLDPEARYEIFTYLENNYKPENRTYLYHHYDDNCSTRIRDVIDRAVDGQFKDATSGTGEYTLREQTKRVIGRSFLTDWILSFAMGPRIDKPMMVWDEMFLPSELGKQAKAFTYTDTEGRDRKLVKEVQVLNKDTVRPRAPKAPVNNRPLAWILGAVAAAVGLLLRVNAQNRRLLRVLSGGYFAMISLVFGLIGSLLFFMSLFTNHDVTFHNINLFFVNPLFLVLFVVSLSEVFGAKTAPRTAGLLWTILALGYVGALGIKLFPGVTQGNGISLGLIGPMILTQAFWFLRAQHRSRKLSKQIAA